jgi:hypothetical protein
MNSLKISIVASSVILALGAIIAWKNHQQLTTAQVKQNHIITDLTNIGFHVDRSHPEKGVCLTKRARKNEEENIINLNNPRHLADLIQKITIALKHDFQLFPENEDLNEDLNKNFYSLDFEDLRILFTELQTNQDFEKTGNGNFILDELINTLYQRARIADSVSENMLLKLASEFPEFFKDNSKAMTMFSFKLADLLKKDTDAAIEWVQQNHLKFPGLIQDSSFTSDYISTLATINPSRSFELITELAIKNVDDAIETCALHMYTNEERTSFLNALHKYKFSANQEKSHHQIIDNCKWYLARAAIRGEFDTATQWLNVVENQPDDWENIFNYVGNGDENTETITYEKWAEWIGKNLPAESIDSSIYEIVSNWTDKDYMAAGEWLVKTTEGPAKHAAIRAYVENIAYDDPAAAVQWADILPPGETRDRTLNIIYNKWPKTDLAGKDAFGKLHHLE